MNNKDQGFEVVRFDNYEHDVYRVIINWVLSPCRCRSSASVVALPQQLVAQTVLGYPLLGKHLHLQSQCCSDGVYLTFSTRASIKLDANVGYPPFGCCALNTPVCCTCLGRSPYDAPAVHRLRPDTCVHCRVPVAGALPAC